MAKSSSSCLETKKSKMYLSREWPTIAITCRAFNKWWQLHWEGTLFIAHKHAYKWLRRPHPMLLCMHEPWFVPRHLNTASTASKRLNGIESLRKRLQAAKRKLNQTNVSKSQLKQQLAMQLNDQLSEAELCAEKIFSACSNQILVCCAL